MAYAPADHLASHSRAGIPYASYPHVDALPMALVTVGATANPVRHGTAPDLAAVADLAGGAHGRIVVAGGIALAVGLPTADE